MQITGHLSTLASFILLQPQHYRVYADQPELSEGVSQVFKNGESGKSNKNS